MTKKLTTAMSALNEKIAKLKSWYQRKPVMGNVALMSFAVTTGLILGFAPLMQPLPQVYKFSDRERSVDIESSSPSSMPSIKSNRIDDTPKNPLATAVPMKVVTAKPTPKVSLTPSLSPILTASNGPSFTGSQPPSIFASLLPSLDSTPIVSFSPSDIGSNTPSSVSHLPTIIDSSVPSILSSIPTIFSSDFFSNETLKPKTDTSSNSTLNVISNSTSGILRNSTSTLSGPSNSTINVAFFNTTNTTTNQPLILDSNTTAELNSSTTSNSTLNNATNSTIDATIDATTNATSNATTNVTINATAIGIISGMINEIINASSTQLYGSEDNLTFSSHSNSTFTVTSNGELNSTTTGTINAASPQLSDSGDNSTSKSSGNSNGVSNLTSISNFTNPSQSTSSPPLSRLELERILASVSNLDDLNDSTSYQHRALNWMVSVNITSNVEEYLIKQKYILAALFFATDGDSWTHSYNFLSMEKNECEWKGSPTGILEGVQECDDNLRVTKLSLGEFISFYSTYMISLLIYLCGIFAHSYAFTCSVIQRFNWDGGQNTLRIRFSYKLTVFELKQKCFRRNNSNSNVSIFKFTK